MEYLQILHSFTHSKTKGQYNAKAEDFKKALGGKPFLKKRVRAAQAKIPQTPSPKNLNYKRSNSLNYKRSNS